MARPPTRDTPRQHALKILPAPVGELVAPVGELVAPVGELVAPVGELVAPVGDVPFSRLLDSHLEPRDTFEKLDSQVTGVRDPVKRPPFLLRLVVQATVDIVHHAFGNEDAHPLRAGSPTEVNGGRSGRSRESRHFIAVGRVLHLFDIPAFIRGVAAEAKVQRLRRQMERKRLQLASENGDSDVRPQPFVAQGR